MIMALYAYCLLRISPNHIFAAMRGIDARPVFPFRCDKYAMLVSRLERDFPFSARSIAEHGRLISRVFQSHTVLPMRFGTFFRSEKQISELIRENKQEFLETFCRLRGKAEMRLKVVLSGAAESWETRRKPPQKYVEGERNESNGDGEASDLLSQQMAAELAARLRHVLHPVDEQVFCRKIEGNQFLVDCAHLIDAGQVEAYQKLSALASDQVKDCAVRMSGPWPPYHFLPAAIRLRTASPAPSRRTGMVLAMR
jgi:hypothetical protein